RLNSRIGPAVKEYELAAMGLELVHIGIDGVDDSSVLFRKCRVGINIECLPFPNGILMREVSIRPKLKIAGDGIGSDVLTHVAHGSPAAHHFFPVSPAVGITRKHKVSLRVFCVYV